MKHITCVDCRHLSQEMSSSLARQECTLRWPMLIKVSADAIKMLYGGALGRELDDNLSISLSTLELVFMHLASKFLM